MELAFSTNAYLNFSFAEAVRRIAGIGYRGVEIMADVPHAWPAYLLPEQKQAMLAMHTGKLGGPLADLASLIGEVVGVYDLPIDFNFAEGKGTIRIGDVVSAEMQPYTDAQGRPTKLVDSIFSTIPGSPAFLGKAMSYQVNLPKHDMKWEFNGRNAVLGMFRFEA